MTIQLRRRCVKCKGWGRIHADTGAYYFRECPDCDGTGYKSDEEVHRIEKEENEKLKEENEIIKSKLSRIQKILNET